MRLFGAFVRYICLNSHHTLFFQPVLSLAYLWMNWERLLSREQLTAKASVQQLTRARTQTPTLLNSNSELMNSWSQFCDIKEEGIVGPRTRFMDYKTAISCKF